ncbi:MAG: glycosyltransferase [Fibrobacterota bacterium]
MIKADLHCHSLYSKHPSDWFLQRIGTAESYTTLHQLHRIMMSEGMDFYALTDHNTMEGSLRLKEMYPHTVVTGVESTVYFPEDNCKTHILLYGLSPEEFERVQTIRRDIYAFRDYIMERNLTHSVAHATFSVNNRLTPEHVEKLLLMFNTFESINGGRTEKNNRRFSRLLDNLTPQIMEELAQKHGITPDGPTPWEKGRTAGSDDHAGLYLATTYTTANTAHTPEELLEAVRCGKTNAAGRSSDFRSITFHFYKIAIDFSAQKSTHLSNSIISRISRFLISGQTLGFRDKLSLIRMKNSRIKNHIRRLIEELRGTDSIDIRNQKIYDAISDVTDDISTELFGSLSGKIRSGDVAGLFRAVSSILPPLFLTAPFISSMKLQNKDNRIISILEGTCRIHREKTRKKRIIWFSDTIFELNGPAESLKQIARTARRENMDILLAVTADEEDNTQVLPEGTVILPAVSSTRIPQYRNIKIRIPSILKTVETIDRLQADEIVISTPGPLGLIALILAKVTDTPVNAVFHTDFSMQAENITGESSVRSLVESYIKWYYSQADRIFVPSAAYMKILQERDYPAHRFELFHRGIDTELFQFEEKDRSRLNRKYPLAKSFVLLYTGRISRDKNIDFILDIYRELYHKHVPVSLIVVGDGPDLESCRREGSNYETLFFTGRLKREELRMYYSAADLFLFPSTTDTFGMSLLEALTCGLPALVSNVGGPADLVADIGYGHALSPGLTKQWKERIYEYMSRKENDFEEYIQMRRRISAKTAADRSWAQTLRKYPFTEELPAPAQTSARPSSEAVSFSL